jgi:RNA polymerase sigma-70 factor (ECF subfamily)
LNALQDQHLLAEATAGNENALRALLARHGGRIHACALRFTGDAQTAEEITQDVFVRLMREAPRIRFDSSLATWLYRVTLNRCYDRMRQDARHAHAVSLERPAVQQLPVPVEVEAQVEARERVDALERALADLPAAMRDVVILRYAAGLEYAEIAETLDVPPGSVASRLHRALRHLGQLLERRGLNAENLL